MSVFVIHPCPNCYHLEHLRYEQIAYHYKYCIHQSESNTACGVLIHSAAVGTRVRPSFYIDKFYGLEKTCETCLLIFLTRET